MPQAWWWRPVGSRGRGWRKATPRIQETPCSAIQGSYKGHTRVIQGSYKRAKGGSHDFRSMVWGLLMAAAAASAAPFLEMHVLRTSPRPAKSEMSGCLPPQPPAFTSSPRCWCTLQHESHWPQQGGVSAWGQVPWFLTLTSAWPDQLVSPYSCFLTYKNGISISSIRA